MQLPATFEHAPTNVTTFTNTAHWVESPWQRYDGNGMTNADISGTPTKGDGMIDRTGEYTDPTNRSKWVKTHYTHLQGQTVNSSYTRGDNISIKVKHYVHTSHLDSNDNIYMKPLL